MASKMYRFVCRVSQNDHYRIIVLLLFSTFLRKMSWDWFCIRQIGAPSVVGPFYRTQGVLEWSFLVEGVLKFFLRRIVSFEIVCLFDEFTYWKLRNDNSVYRVSQNYHLVTKMSQKYRFVHVRLRTSFEMLSFFVRNVIPDVRNSKIFHTGCPKPLFSYRVS